MTKNSVLIKSCLAAAILVCANLAATEISQAQDKENAGAIISIFPGRPAVRLNATVTHNEDFPPLPKQVAPGAVFVEGEVLKLLPTEEDRWYQVPRWLAGEFSYGDQTRYELKDFETGKVTHPNDVTKGVKEGRYRGLLVDKAGNVWQISHGGKIDDPGHPNGEPGNVDRRRYDDDILGFMVSPTEYIETSDGVEFYIDKKTNKIDMVVRYERIRTFKLEKDGTVSDVVSEEKFAPNGQPLFKLMAKGHMLKQKEFTPVTPIARLSATHEDVVSSLRKFMVAIGKGDSAPDDLPSIDITKSDKTDTVAP